MRRRSFIALRGACREVGGSSDDDTTAQLIKPKTFSFVWALIWFLCFGVGILVYVFYYMAKRDEAVYLSVANGVVSAA